MMMFRRRYFCFSFFLACLLTVVLHLSFSLSMCDFKIGTLNINGARDDSKRAAFFKLMELKKIDVVLLQETHSTEENENDWKRGYNGEVILSHKSSCSGGVGIVFSRSFLPFSYEVEEIIKGCLLKVKAQYENITVVFINIYAPTNRMNRLAVLDILSDTIKNCSSEEHLFLGGDFNCTENPKLDRNHQEPHPASSQRLKQTTETHELTDVWRFLNKSHRQYTWSHSKDNVLSLARLDRLYSFKHHMSIFKSCHINPVGFSDHCLVFSCVFIKNVRLQSAYWHFNTALLHNKVFRAAFKCFWLGHRKCKSDFACVQQWWDCGKSQIKQLCQQFTRNVTRDITRSMRDLEAQVVDLQTLAGSTGDRGLLSSLKSKRSALANLLGIAAQGALVRSRFINVTEMDAPSQFFFGLEKKNGQKKIIHSLRSSSGSAISDSSEIRKYAVSFYKDLYKSELTEHPDVCDSFYSGLPQMDAEANAKLEAQITMNELYTAMMSLQSGRAPGIDGLPVDFYKSFWSVLGEDLLEVITDSLERGQLPLSCRRAVITLLPKKGDLQELKNWRPVSLLCTDYKILSKVLASRLREMMASVIHVDQTYCVPGRLISDNVALIRDVLEVSSSLAVKTGLISIDQEKAFDRVEHQYLWQTLAAFGFNPGFIAKIQVLYSDIASVLKINGGLSAPFNVQRGVRQGCSLSGMLYSLAFEPLLHKLRNSLTGVCFPNCDASFKLSAYADDVIILVNKQKDIDTLVNTINQFSKISSAKINWGKSEAVMVGDQLGDRLRLPGGLIWNKGGFKYLGVFLGNETFLLKNWDNILEKVKGRLTKWRWLLPKMSYRGRVLVINNLVSSALWHRLACVDPPAPLLSQVQRVLVDFFWDKLHWVPQSVLFLSREEGGQGLVHLASRGAAFRLQFLKRLLTGPTDLVWRSLSSCILQRVGGLGLGLTLFLTDHKKVDTSSLPGFYKSVFSVWSKLEKKTQEQGDSLYWMLQEPVLCGRVLDFPSWGGPALSRLLLTAGVSTLGQVVELAGPGLDDPVGLVDRMRTRSTRLVNQLLQHWRQKLNIHQLSLLKEYCEGTLLPDCTDPFPDIGLYPDLKNCSGFLLERVDDVGVSLENASGKTMYKLMVKTLNQNKLNGRNDTPWREYLDLDPGFKPEWRSLYKPPLTKKQADLQWRILHGIVAVNSFISVINAAVEDRCPFCDQRETVFHCFSECPRLTVLFLLLGNIFSSFKEHFKKQSFICGFKYTRQQRNKCQILNFVLGQAKMAVYVTRRKKVEESLNIDVVPVFIGMVKSRLLVDFSFYKAFHDLEKFQGMWGYGGVLCTVKNTQLCFGKVLSYNVD